MQTIKDNNAPGPRKQKYHRKAVWRGMLVIILVSLLTLAYLLWGRVVIVVSNVSFLTRQEVAETIRLEGILLKNEHVLQTPVSGKLQQVAADGNRLENGARVSRVIAVQDNTGGESYDIVTPVAGICCMHLDGLEQVLSPASIDSLAVPHMAGTGGKRTYDGMRVEKGQAVAKIIDNLSPVYIYAEAPKENFSAAALEKGTWWKANWEGQTFSMKSYKVADRGESLAGYFLLSAYPEQILHERKVVINVTTRSLNGYLVPKKAIVEKDGQTGIFLSIKKKAYWTPVDVVGELEGKLAIEGPELTESCRFVQNPLLAKEDHWVE
jgi:putative membrane fusion protein